ncbi:MAG TPA: hypothetical protein VMH02_01635 [Verrucomicrobiae bacterium]|nr:hypothetical protein [Verrucomicrobiae bacterium]
MTRSPSAWRALPAFLALPALLAANAPAGADAVIRQAVAMLASERAGLTAFHQHYSYVEYGPGHHETIVEESGRLRQDGRPIAVRLYSRVTNGKSASAADLAAAQSQLDKQLPAEDYRLPVTLDALSEYRFAPSASCGGCAAGAISIDFTSLVRDADHGDGTAIIDSVTHHIERIAFRPSVLPAHVDDATIVMTFERVLPDLWDLVDTESHYSGHVLFLHGGADITVTDGAYRRFKTLAQARAALADGI